MLEFSKGPFLVLKFSYYTLMTFLICNLLSVISTLHCKCNRASYLWQQLELVSELEFDLRKTVDWGKKWLVDFNAGKAQLVWFDWSNNTGAINVKIDTWGKSSFKMLGFTFSSKLDWVSFIISITTTASKKIGALICFMKFLSPEPTLYLYKSTIRPYMEYCSFLEQLDSGILSL